MGTRSGFEEEGRTHLGASLPPPLIGSCASVARSSSSRRSSSMRCAMCFGVEPGKLFERKRRKVR
jgi:hypothetical protein